MVKLYRYDPLKHKWVFIRLGLIKNAEVYANKGYVVIYN
jgi:hypothetical protein